MANKFKKSRVSRKSINLEEVDFAIDTALSWDGTFPKPGKGDYLVTLISREGDEAQVLVSRRYVGARDARDAASIAKNAYAERHGLKMKDVRTLRSDAVK